MTIATATTARFIASAHSTPVLLCDVEDLHDADLDLVLADTLADAYNASDMAIALARLLGEPAPTALAAHDLGARAGELTD